MYSDVFVLAEMLLAKGERGLAVEAMRELANLHYHTGNMRGAFRWWSDALDKLLGATDAIHNWRSLFKVSPQNLKIIVHDVIICIFCSRKRISVQCCWTSVGCGVAFWEERCARISLNTF